MKMLFALLRRHWLFFALVTLAALGLRLLFVFLFPHVAGDTFIYGDIAKTWLTHGVYGFTDNLAVRPTLIRLPGYPAFLAAMFAVFGREHYGAVMIGQAVIDTNTCLVIAALALELMDERAAKIAYVLAALCPFTANYTAAPLTETLAIACAAHALYYGVRGLKALATGLQGGVLWLLAGLWVAGGALIRPDGLLVLGGLGLALFYCLFRYTRRQVILAGLLLLAASLSSLAPWAARNWHTFGVFQPLAPRYANDPGEFLPMGFNHWVRTWIADYVSVEDVYWPVSGEAIRIDALPLRAFDSPEQQQATTRILERYNQQLFVDPEMDAEFERLAKERVARHPLRYYAGLPALRITGMWLRPRTEMLPIDPRWWQYEDHPAESGMAMAMAGLNLLLLAAAAIGWKRWPLGTAAIALAGFVLLRSAFLGTLENPEPRYLLECFPVVLALAGGAFARREARPETPDSKAGIFATNEHE
ncbi:MAG: glycosyltransferase family 39 protein [Acidobacteriia bacterium]|nr:glycosyltransferase family 39 protein [Terriglobia bacterium]